MEQSMIRLVKTSRRTVFYRGEKVALKTAVMNFEPQNFYGCRLNLELPERTLTIHLPTVNHHVAPPAFEFETADFPGSWNVPLRLSLTQNGRPLAAASLPFELVPPPHTGQMEFWHWPSTVHYDALEADDSTARRELKKLRMLGVTWSQLRANWAILHPDTAIRRIEDAMRLGIQLGLLIENTAGGVFLAEEGDPDDARRIDADGTRSPFLNPNSAYLRDKVRFLVKQLGALFAEFPSCSTIFLNSELEDKLKLPCDPDSVRKHENALGFPLTRLRSTERVFAESFPDAPCIEPGVIADDDPELQYAHYYFRSGDGWTPTNRLVGDTARAKRPGWVTIADPFRLCPVPERFDGVDLISSWTYTNPDPKLTLFAETLEHAAARAHKDFIHNTTLWNYAGTLTPCGENRFSREHTLRMGPDRYRECAWINLSRGPRALGCYFGSPIELFFESGDPLIFSPETEQAIADFNRSVLKPFGALARTAEKAPRRCAVLDAYSSRIYGGLPRCHAYYQNYQVYDFYTVMNMAQLPADILFEEDIQEGALQRYELLALPAAPVLTETVCRSIREFARNGGIVIADSSLKADIPGVRIFDFDFSYRRQVNANAISSGRDFSITDDTNFRSEWGGKIEAEGVTADEDQRRLESCAAELRRVLDPLIRRDFDCNSPKVLNNLRVSGNTRYLFAVNDNRTWDLRSGFYRAMMEKGLPLQAEWTLPADGGKPEVRELVSGTRIPVRVLDSGEYTFDFTLPAAGGAIFAVSCEQPKPLSAEIREIPGGAELHLHRGTVELRPLKIEIIRPDGTKDESGMYTLLQEKERVLPIPDPAVPHSGEWRAEWIDYLTGTRHTIVWKRP